jgi:argininosuccinate synthase
MTILRLAHLDAESLVMDGKVRSLRDQFVTHHWSELLYNGLYFSPEREFIENSLVFSQRRVVCITARPRLSLRRGVWGWGIGPVASMSPLTFEFQLECGRPTSLL